MACISCGVITSAWLCRNSSFCVSAIDPRLTPHEHYPAPVPWDFTVNLQTKFLAQVQSSNFRIIYNIVWLPFHEDFTRINDVGPVGQPQRLTHVVVSDEHTNTAV